MGRGARRRKTRTHVKPSEEEINKVPKSFVMKSGAVGNTVSFLVRDVRRVMEPYTATHLKERKANRLKDFVMVAPQLGVTHFMIFSRTEKSTNLRIARVPRGPTLTFRVDEYSLTKDCLRLQKSPRTNKSDYLTSPLLVLNNFKQEGKQFKLMSAMLQNMFPSIDVQTMQLSKARRVLLFNYNEETGKIDMRHYSIGVKATGVSKSIKRIVEMSLPDMSKYEDISDYVMKEAIVSESDVEDGPESTVTLSQDLPGRNNRKNQQRAVRLHEIGPRLTLDLLKIENGLCNGEVLYHKYIRKTREEEAEQRQKFKEKEAARKARLEKKEAERRNDEAEDEDMADAEDDDEEED
ncbi:Brix domain-containing protein [Dichotomocladium elegans]|nr:Brix domain-containing protein [Dichotomocladium elegans]